MVLLTDFLTLFTGIWLEAAPFFIIGILLSNVITVLVPDSFFQKRIFKNPLIGIPFGIFCGFFMPICDCASVPVFKKLIDRGMPYCTAIAFLLAAPIVNPVVLISTWYAYNGNLKIVLSRTILGIICTLIASLTFAFGKGKIGYSKQSILVMKENVFKRNTAKNNVAKRSPLEIVILILTQSQKEFLTTGIWQSAGIFLAAIFQTIIKMGNGSSSFTTLFGATNATSLSNTLLLIAIMMMLAYVLSLCSSSDAIICNVIARSLPPVAQLAFLVFGPMMDIKNTVLLSGLCSPKLALRIALTTVFVCFAVFAILAAFNLGAWLI